MTHNMTQSNHTNHTNPNRVLIICHAFPPSGGAGVQRNAKLAKYLPDFGWEPIVWTAPPHPNLPRDQTLERELPKNLSHHVGPAIFPDHWPARSANAIEPFLRSAGCHERTSRAGAWRLQATSAKVTQLLMPDESVLWATAGFNRLRSLIIRERVDVILSSLGPPSCHLLALLLKRATRRPWIADYRDLWTDDFWYPFREGPAWRRYIDRAIENRFLAEANAITSVSEPQRKILAARANRDEATTRTITNGFDESDFAGLNRAAVRAEIHGDRDTFILAHVGRFSAERVRPEMLQALAKLASEVNTKPNQPRFILRVVGEVSSTAQRMLFQSNIPLEMTRYVPHDRAVREMIAADALLLQYPDGPNADTAVSGKLFEYFAAGNPIVAVTPTTSETRRLVESTNAGLGADINRDAVYAAVSHLWRHWNAGTPLSGCQHHDTLRFTRRAVAQQFASVLHAAKRRELNPGPATSASPPATRTNRATPRPDANPRRRDTDFESASRTEPPVEWVGG
jgi:glycosyltransferase involved in cell wall biosynthesis